MEDDEVVQRSSEIARRTGLAHDAIALHGDQSLGLLKTELGDDFSYGEIKAVVASLQ